MNQTFSGLMLIGMIALCALILFAIAIFMKPKQKSTDSKSPKLKINQKNKPKFKNKQGAFSRSPDMQLVKLNKRVAQHLPEFTTHVRQHHVVLERDAKKVAMLTVDKAAAIGHRRLGEVTVINFHVLPSVEELCIELHGI